MALSMRSGVQYSNASSASPGSAVRETDSPHGSGSVGVASGAASSGGTGWTAGAGSTGVAGSVGTASAPLGHPVCGAAYTAVWSGGADATDASGGACAAPAPLPHPVVSSAAARSTQHAAIPLRIIRAG
ncbi:hypothetical protein [Arthrobacter sp. zg-Y769]|uniref:hypothetical protein n=1 Tax=Arthrobacter sp. zg-Y769 TaxID=2894191 RepID=UPI001E40AA87|nr:hypothetical protein [Arthrobacter sp. zg-Y769]MCC9205077.1 hypothetical protein [Arthrobacter sp. zg-Y769]